jgi:hypothetical protein
MTGDYVDDHGETAITSARAIARTEPDRQVTVQVNPHWAVCVGHKAYHEGDLVDLPIVQAAEWLAWGSVDLPDRAEHVEHVPPKKPPARKRTP